MCTPHFCRPEKNIPAPFFLFPVLGTITSSMLPHPLGVGTAESSLRFFQLTEAASSAVLQTATAATWPSVLRGLESSTGRAILVLKHSEFQLHVAPPSGLLVQALAFVPQSYQIVASCNYYPRFSFSPFTCLVS